MKSNRKFTKNSAAFTGLEAAIVLIAFVVVAAVFSYVMLGAGFFTSQKSKEVVHTGVDQATSSIELAGDIIGGSAGGTAVEYIDLTLSLTAGNNPVDLEKTVVSYTSSDDYVAAIWGDGDSTHYDYVAAYGGTWTGATAGKGPLTPATGYLYYWVQSNQVTPNNLLEQFEKVTLHVGLTDASNGLNGALTQAPGTNYNINIEIKPASGASLMIPLKTPPVIKTIMTLL